MSQSAYEEIIKSTHVNFPNAPGVDECLRFCMVEDLIAAYTGVKPIENDMCINSCLAFTGPFLVLKRCSTCNSSCWNEVKLQASNGCLKVLVKTFMTLLLGPQLQALYHDPESACTMTYLQTCTCEILDEYHHSQNIPPIDGIVAGWDYLRAYLDHDIKDNDIMVMTSLDGAQLYEDKESDCWIAI